MQSEGWVRVAGFWFYSGRPASNGTVDNDFDSCIFDGKHTAW